MEDNPSLFVKASEAVARKDKPAAKKLLDELIFNEPGNEQAWLLLADVVDDINEASDCLQQALAINPHDPVAQQKYDDLLRWHPDLVELDPARAAGVTKESTPDLDAKLNLDKIDTTPLFGDEGRPPATQPLPSQPVEPVPTTVEASTKESEPDPNLDLDQIDLTPLFADSEQ